ncbi:MAG: glycoside hydrolase family 92 protein [Bacteroidota bacterium]|nr:glycoside hydrolase family 92 protein [Bacteroidota bacterium]
MKWNSRDLWERKLSKIVVEGEEDNKKLFYSNLYRAFQAPYNTTSSDGSYRGSDGKIYKADGFTFYQGWSIWDNFRTQLPLLTILEPEISLDICKSLVELYKQGKFRWASTTEPFPTVRTEHSSIVLLDAYKKGITNFNIEAAYHCMLQEVDSLPYASPDNILESSYDYWALSEIAGIIGKENDRKKFLEKANQYKKVWRDKFLVMDTNSDIMHGDGLYEGTLWQYRWFVTWDVPGLMELIGGEEEFVDQLTHFFEKDLYNHGNQPDIHAPFLFNFFDSPWKTQKWVNQILTKDMIQWYGTHDKWDEPYIGKIYKNSPQGYLFEMDEDMGTMSSWYVLSAIGIYPQNVGEPYYHLTSPIFNRLKIETSTNTWFEIQAPAFNDSNFYIDKAILNNTILEKNRISHKTLTEGGFLKLELTDVPKKHIE